MLEGVRLDTKHSSMNIGKNQYLIGTTGVVRNQDVRCSIRIHFCNYVVFMGEGCLYTTVQSVHRSALLLGYIVDAGKKQNNTDELLKEFLSAIHTDSANVSDCVKFWGGRWCLFFEVEGKINVITDTCGLKQVFFYVQNQVLTLASQARYIADLYSLKENDSAKAHISKAMMMDKEYSWPADATLYDDVKRLLPNHILTEKEGKAKRYNTSGYRVENPILEMADLLKSQMRGLQKEKPCALTITAGLDSRLVLAAADKKDEKYKAVTLQYNGVNDRHVDLTVPAEICKEVGVKHDIIRCVPIDVSFKERYNAHGENAHSYWLQMAYAVEINGYDSYVWVKGSCNEVLRNSCGVLNSWQITPNILCKLFKIPYDDFSEMVLSEWLQDAKSYCKINNMRLLDLFYWEHRCGSWLSECLNESDLVSETFTPFNCRAYLELGLMINEARRMPPSYTLFAEIIEKCGLRVGVPVNAGRYSSLKSKVKILLKNRLHLLYGLIISFHK